MKIDKTKKFKLNIMKALHEDETRRLQKDILGAILEDEIPEEVLNQGEQRNVTPDQALAQGDSQPALDAPKPKSEDPAQESAQVDQPVEEVSSVDAAAQPASTDQPTDTTGDGNQTT